MKSLTAEIIGTSLAQVGTTIAALAAAVILLEFLVWLVAAKVLRMRNPLVPMLIAPASRASPSSWSSRSATRCAWPSAT